MATRYFTAEQLRNPFSLTLLVGVPFLFILAAAGALSDFADALGGELHRDAATTLAAGWATAFVSGSIGFFQAISSCDADRRLSLAGAGPLAVAGSRIAASVTMALIASAAALLALALESSIEHPAHAAIGVIAFAITYLAVGVTVGSLVRAELEGSLLVVFVFLLDVFAGPGMTGDSPPWAITQHATKLLTAAGLASTADAEIWVKTGVIAFAALAIAFVAFSVSARRQS